MARLMRPTVVFMSSVLSAASLAEGSAFHGSPADAAHSMMALQQPEGDEGLWERAERRRQNPAVMNRLMEIGGKEVATHIGGWITKELLKPKLERLIPGVELFEKIMLVKGGLQIADLLFSPDPFFDKNRKALGLPKRKAILDGIMGVKANLHVAASRNKNNPTFDNSNCYYTVSASDHFNIVIPGQDGSLLVLQTAKGRYMPNDFLIHVDKNGAIESTPVPLSYRKLVVDGLELETLHYKAAIQTQDPEFLKILGYRDIEYIKSFAMWSLTELINAGHDTPSDVRVSHYKNASGVGFNLTETERFSIVHYKDQETGKWKGPILQLYTDESVSYILDDFECKRILQRFGLTEEYEQVLSGVRATQNNEVEHLSSPSPG